MGVMLDQSINEIHIVDSKSLNFIHVNQGGVKNLGYRLDELVNMSLLEVYSEYRSDSYALLIHPLLNGEQSHLHFETIHRRKDGSYYPVEVWLQLYRNNSESLVAIALDITQRKKHEEKIERLNNFYATLSNINKAIVQINHEDDLFETVCKISAQINHVKMAWIGKPDGHQLLYAAAAAGERFVYLHQQRIPLQADVTRDVTQDLHATNRAFLENRIIVVNEFQNDFGTPVWPASTERSPVWKSSCTIPITLNQQPYAVLSVYSDQLNFFDVAERHKKNFALLFIDLDHFKNINDALGHSVGDQILIEVGKRLVSAVREEDTVARVGGDEFNIQLMECDWHGAAKVANQILVLMSEPIQYKHYQLYVKPSIGISLYPENGDC